MKPDENDQSEDLEGVDAAIPRWEYPLDSVSVRTETRTIHEVVVRRIGKGFYIMDPDFQRDFVWDEVRQSRLIESVLMRIPLPVFYLAENLNGKLVVVDGLQRLTTFQRFLDNKLRLRLDNADLNQSYFRDLSPKLQNRIEDTQITLYVIDSKVPDRARLDIFERVNGGVALSRQQMRNALYQGKATVLLRELAQAPIFLKVTGNSLQSKTMRDREAINRFCAFFVLGLNDYRDDMDQFLGETLSQMNQMTDADLEEIRASFLRSMLNNFVVFGKHSFRKHSPGQDVRKLLNMSLFDVFSTGLAYYSESLVANHQQQLREGFFRLMNQAEFIKDITYGTNGRARVAGRFAATQKLLEEVLRAV